MDVLRYSATNAENKIRTNIATQCSAIPGLATCSSNLSSCITTVQATCATLQAQANAFDAAGVCWLQCIEPCLLRRPETTTLWSCIPGGSGWTGGFKVCNTSAQFNCGFCCAWTVPAGVTCARFQLWGAGGGSGSNHCCGGSPFGSTGAYASVSIPVTAGSVYTICSGCAYCCFPSRRAQGRVDGCPSFVQGTGLTNFCADGGQGRLGVWALMYQRRNTMRYATFSNNYGGPCFCCQGSHYCFQNSCSTCGEIPYVGGASYYGTASGAIVYGIRGIWPRICFDNNHYGYQVHAPIYGFDTSTQCCFTWTTGTCCGKLCQACCGILQVPGAGGWPTIAMGGNYGTCGDMGRMGMVCVCFK